MELVSIARTTCSDFSLRCHYLEPVEGCSFEDADATSAENPGIYDWYHYIRLYPARAQAKRMGAFSMPNCKALQGTRRASQSKSFLGGSMYEKHSAMWIREG